MTLTRRLSFLAVLAAPLISASRAFAQSNAPSRPTLAIDTFDGAELTAGTVASSSLVAILADILIESGHFAVIEPPGTGARFLLRSAVTRYDPAAGGAGLQVGGLPAFGRRAGASARTKTTTVGLSMRLIEAASGQVVAAAKAEGSASGQDADAGLLNDTDGSTMGATSFRGTSVAKAFEIAMRKAVDEITREAPIG
jgi:hypothetical protein